MSADRELDTRAVLRTRPTQNSAVRAASNEQGMMLFVPVARPPWLRALSLLLPLRKEKGFALDALGREVWLACDGARSFEDIVLEFAEQHQLRFHEARALVSAFLKTLSERNLVALVLAETASSP